ncbi:MAG: linear amide C-N hydrolase [Chitinophagaceae bacterium]|nr:linear amide C-N hydrolase [Chitinophagaceae bacterium]HRC02995.1 linear amide C-N hydrolase [Niabella sp.]MBK8312357.1 linear amide C-N hydrolase [Chitinophagaceae bacterium]MBK8606207.1 linear amide C-N hydrolase [Chitinophagaceae bacterium]MBP6478302.1 linear amide C-N hydrolase [Chitinophagaceae bacterium]
MNARKLILIFCCIAIAMHTIACSSIVLKNQHSIFLAKNFDWTYGDGYLLKNIRGVQKRAFITGAGTPANWTSKYGSVTFTQNGKEMPYGGMNEKGLAIEMLWLDYTEYYINETTTYLNELEWIQYQLDNYATIDEVVENINTLSIRPIKGKIHFIVADANGQSIVIEHLGGKVRYEVKEANHCQAITNFDATTSAEWHTKNATATGNVANALYRYSLLQKDIVANNFSNNLTANTALDILDNVAIKKGNFKTYWTIVYDVLKKEIFFKTADTKNVKQLLLADLDFSSTTEAIDINTKMKDNIGSNLITYTEDMNTALVSISFKQLGLEQVDAAAISKSQFDFSSTADNSYTTNYITLKIIVTTVDSSKLGKIGIVIMDGEESFKKFLPFRDGFHQISAAGSSYTWVYYGLPKNNYAIAAVQDENNNKRPDFATEKYAFSNGKRLSGGSLPSFEDCKVVMQEGVNEVQLLLQSEK